MKSINPDIDKLIFEGAALYNAMQYAQDPIAFRASGIKQGISAKKIDEVISILPDFRSKYQSWYSEALACVKQLLPDRVDDFVEYYKLSKPPKEIIYGTYTVSNYLEGLRRTSGIMADEIVGTSAALPKFQQQLKIVETLKSRFETSLYDIRTLVQADLFDDELEAAEEVLKKGYERAAGAIAGVVLEGHLKEVCIQHKVKIIKKKPTMSDYYDALKNASVIDTAQWRNLQFLGDIRNLCDHKKDHEPKKEQVSDLIAGTRKVIKTIL